MHPPYPPPNMREEITAAVDFLIKMVETPQLSASMPRLKKNLTKTLSKKYKDHWFIDSPQRGQAYRCIEFCDNQGADKVLATALEMSGLQYSELRLPAELCIWVDPNEVACRFGDDLGSFLPIYMNENGKGKTFIDKFDFSRLCERTDSIPVMMGRSGNPAERTTNRRVVKGKIEEMEVEYFVGSGKENLPPNIGDCLLTPPTTPPYTPTHSTPSPCVPPPPPLPSKPLQPSTTPPTSPVFGNVYNTTKTKPNVLTSSSMLNQRRLSTMSPSYQSFHSGHHYSNNSRFFQQQSYLNNQHHHNQHHYHHDRSTSSHSSPTHHSHHFVGNINGNSSNVHMNGNNIYANGNGYSRSPPRSVGYALNTKKWFGMPNTSHQPQSLSHYPPRDRSSQPWLNHRLLARV